MHSSMYERERWYDWLGRKQFLSPFRLTYPHPPSKDLAHPPNQPSGPNLKDKVTVPPQPPITLLKSILSKFQALPRHTIPSPPATQVLTVPPDETSAIRQTWQNHKLGKVDKKTNPMPRITTTGRPGMCQPGAAQLVRSPPMARGHVTHGTYPA